MKKFMSKAMILTMVAAIACGATACSTSTVQDTSADVTTEAMAEIANPVRESSQDEIERLFAITMQAPEGAEDVRYSIIDTEDQTIAQMDFKLDGKEMCLRATPTTITNINRAANVEAGPESANISGLYYDWSYIGVDQVYDYAAVVRISDEKAGYIGWLDIVPGILYNLSMKEDATPEDLAKYANMTFVPYDGEEDIDVVGQQLTACFDQIYETKAGTPGSEERVEKAALQFNDFIADFDEEIYSLEYAVEETEYALDMLKATHEGEDVDANFKECFNAVVENINETNPNLAEMESYKCIKRAVEIHMEDAGK